MEMEGKKHPFQIACFYHRFSKNEEEPDFCLMQNGFFDSLRQPDMGMSPILCKLQNDGIIELYSGGEIPLAGLHPLSFNIAEKHRCVKGARQGVYIPLTCLFFSATDLTFRQRRFQAVNEFVPIHGVCRSIFL